MTAIVTSCALPGIHAELVEFERSIPRPVLPCSAGARASTDLLANDSIAVPCRREAAPLRDVDSTTALTSQIA